MSNNLIEYFVHALTGTSVALTKTRQDLQNLDLKEIVSNNIFRSWHKPNTWIQGAGIRR